MGDSSKTGKTEFKQFTIKQAIQLWEKRSDGIDLTETLLTAKSFRKNTGLDSLKTKVTIIDSADLIELSLECLATLSHSLIIITDTKNDIERIIDNIAETHWEYGFKASIILV